MAEAATNTPGSPADAGKIPSVKNAVENSTTNIDTAHMSRIILAVYLSGFL